MATGSQEARRWTLVIGLRLLVVLCVHWCVNRGVRGHRVGDAASSDVDDDHAATFRCTTATIFGLVTVDCTAQNATTVTQLALDARRHDRVCSLRLADNRLDRLDSDEFGPLTPRLQQLYLARNLINDIHQHAFRKLPALQVLTLQYYRPTRRASTPRNKAVTDCRLRPRCCHLLSYFKRTSFYCRYKRRDIICKHDIMTIQHTHCGLVHVAGPRPRRPKSRPVMRVH